MKAGGRVGRPVRRPGDAPDVKRQTTHVSASDLAGETRRARTSEAGTPLDATSTNIRPMRLRAETRSLDSLLQTRGKKKKPGAYDRQDVARRQDGASSSYKDISGSTDYTCHHSVSPFIDDNHHTEDWTFMRQDSRSTALRLAPDKLKRDL